MDQIPKPIKRALRQLAEEAYKLELARSLQALRGDFEKWEHGQITAFDLTETIHQFHQGPARELWSRYTHGKPAASVAYAVATGILERSRVPADVLDYLAGPIGFYEAEESAQ